MHWTIKAVKGVALVLSSTVCMSFISPVLFITFLHASVVPWDHKIIILKYTRVIFSKFQDYDYVFPR